MAIEDLSLENLLDAGSDGGGNPTIEDLNPGGNPPTDPPVDPPADPAEPQDPPADPAEPTDPPADPPADPEKDPAKPEGNEGDPTDPPEGGDDEDDEPSIVQSLIETTGLELDPTQYEDTTEGFAKLLKDATKKSVESNLQSIFSQDPELAAHFKYKMLGGDSKEFIDTFFNPKNTEKLEVSEENETTQDKALREYFTIKGFEQDEIDGFIEDMAIAGKKFDRAKQAAESVNQFRERQKQELIKNQEAQRQQQLEQAQQRWNEIETFVKQAPGFKGIALPESEKQEFLEYISKPVDEHGRTQRDLDIANADDETLLAIDLILKKKLDLTKLAEIKKETKAARSLRTGGVNDKKPKTPSGSRGNAKPKAGYDPKLNIDELDFSNFNFS